MGQVWQATDTQLNRQVALKILPDAFASDPDRLARFTREAQILQLENVVAWLVVGGPRRGVVGPSTLPACIAGDAGEVETLQNARVLLRAPVCQWGAGPRRRPARQGGPGAGCDATGTGEAAEAAQPGEPRQSKCNLPTP